MDGSTGTLAQLRDEERDKALARFALVRPILEDGAAIVEIARAHGLTTRTIQRWLRRYRASGLRGLARRSRADRGRPRLPDLLRRLIEGLALQTPRRSIAAVRRLAAEVAAREGWPLPSYKQVRAVVRALDPGLRTLAHEGARAYNEAFDLLHRHEAERPNERWQADHTLLDLWVRDEHGRPARPWLTAILDDASRAIAGYLLGLAAPSAQGTALALHQAIWRKGVGRWRVAGIPSVLYTDHGSDFTSRHLEQVAADLHMRLVFSLPGAPRGRGKIERFFGTVNQLFLCDLPGYAPAGGPPPDIPLLTLPALDARFRAWLLDDYHARAHGETGQPPMARWEAGGFLPRLPESLEQLDLLLLTVARPRTVQQDGIRFQGFRYIDATLAGYVGALVTIRYDPRDVAEVRVFAEGRFVCRAICQELAGRTVGLKEIVQARNERRRHLRQGLSERSALVEMLLAAHRDEPVPLEPEAGPSRDMPTPRLKRYRDE